MAMLDVRLYGDPLTREPSSVGLRRFLTQARASDLRCALCLSHVDGEASTGPGHARPFPLHDGVAAFHPLTTLSDTELEPVLHAAAAEVSGSAPVIVFGTVDLVAQAGFEFPEAREVHHCTGVDATVAWLRGVLPRPDRRRVPIVEHGSLDPFFAVRPATHDPSGVFLHVAGTDERCGTDLVLAAFARVVAESTTRRPRLIVFGSEHDVVEGVEFRSTSPTVDDLRGAVAVVQPTRWMQDGDWRWLLSAMAAARPLILSSFAATNRILDGRGIYLPVGGELVGQRFEPDERALAHHMGEVLRASQRGLGERARRHVLRWHGAVRTPTPSALRVPRRPVLVLEAPLFETSSSSVLTIATARALLRRGNVEVQLRPTTPFRTRYAEFATTHPDLVPHLCRAPADVDLWLSAGWPVRTARPPAQHFAVRLDWEYGALPVDLTPVVTREADTVIVHSEHVRRSLLDAGRCATSAAQIPHGVDGTVFHENAEPLREVVEFKRDRRALLFVGGLIWRKGFDLVIKTLLELDTSVCLVVKPLGSDTSYQGHNLADLVSRVREFPGVPEILVLSRELSAGEMAGLYRACDVLLHPYRGEGFCMPALEARACGLPVIVTAGGSTDDFCTGDACVRIPSTRRAIDLPGVHVGQPYVHEPDFPSTLAVVRRVLGSIDVFTEVARREAAAARADYTWDRAAERLEQLTFAAARRPTVAPRHHAGVMP